MKIAAATLLFCSLAWAVAGETPPQRTKSSAVQFKIEDELKDFYLHLVDTDQGVQKAMTSLIVKAGDSSSDILESSVPVKGPNETRGWYASGSNNHYSISQPRVVAWFPGETDGNTEKFDTEQNYLVIVAVSQSHRHGESTYGALVAEFHAAHTGTTVLNKAGTKAGLVANRLTLTFLGFRQFQIDPITARGPIGPTPYQAGSTRVVCSQAECRHVLH